MSYTTAAASWFLFGFYMMLFFGSVTSYSISNDDVDGRGYQRSVTYKYDRVDEVNRECGFVLKSACELKPDDNRLYAITEQLSFINGDWWQESDAAAPLMPFDDRDLSKDRTMDVRSPLNLASFWVTDVDRVHRNKHAIFVSGILQMGITSGGLFSDRPYEVTPRFDVWPGRSQLSVIFEGIYTESKNGGGERVMCLLGSAVLPSREPDSSDPWSWLTDSGYTNQPLLAQDDRILLVLSYPKTLTLRSREIRGSMRSLNPRSNPKYFDEVRLSSWFSSFVNYEFTSEDLVSKACDPYPYKDSMISENAIDIYKGLDFCVILQRFTHQEALTVLPNWRCNSTDDFCRRLGPFSLDKEINTTDGSFKNVDLVLQDVRCQKTTSDVMRIASVIRVVHPSENKYTAAERTGLSNLTLSAEGIWKSSSGQLCMVGCSKYGCDNRICLYVPLSFSINQRSIIMGALSSIDSSNQSYFPLSFEKSVRVAELWDQYTSANPYYKFSKINAAGAVLEKDEPFSLGSVVKKSLLMFPKIEATEQYLNSLTLLSEDLTLHVTAVPDPYPNALLSITDFELEILSIGPLFGRYWPTTQNGTNFEKQANPYRNKGELTEEQLLLNVSAQINLMAKSYSNLSSLFVEGLYDSHVGKMYLIGCRNVRASWKTLYESMDLESGLDCLIEVIVSYPPTTSRWLVNPTAKISLTSQRNEDDPLYFKPIKLQTVAFMYRRQREGILTRRGVEGILRILTLSVAIACVSSQLFYIKVNVDSVPYISLVMLGVQALGYSIPLITGAEALFKKTSEDFSESQSYDLKNSQWIHVIDYTVKFMVLVAFILTLRLSQKVWKSRVRMLMRAPLEPHRVPSDKRVFLSTLIIHLIGYATALIVHYNATSRQPLQTSRFLDTNGYSHSIREWEIELEEYLGLVQDFFLLPQVIANVLWRIESKPLGRGYYVGITVVRLLPHLYDVVKPPIPNPYFAEEYEFVNPYMDFFSKFGDVAIVISAILLAVAVYVQQKWNYDKLSEKLVLGRARLLPIGSKVYERLPSVSFEAELASSGGNRNHDHEIE